MTLTLDQVTDLLNKPKTLVPPFRWNEVRRQDRRSAKHQFEEPLPVQRYDLVASTTIEGGVPRGLRFRFSVFTRRLYAATFQLECNRSTRDRTVHILYRMEWRPIRGHTNGRHADSAISFRVFSDGETHHHSCLDHLGEDGALRAGDVHLARPIDPDPPDLNSALAFVCATLNITNGSVLPEPRSQGQLF